MTQNRQRHPDGGGAGKVVLLKQISTDHTGNAPVNQRPNRRDAMDDTGVTPQLGSAMHNALTFGGSVIATSLHDGVLKITVELDNQLPVDLVFPIESKNAGIQMAGRQLLKKIFLAAGISTMQDSDQLIGNQVAVAVNAGASR